MRVILRHVKTPPNFNYDGKGSPSPLSDGPFAEDPKLIKKSHGRWI